jgi:hypothetical protein
VILLAYAAAAAIVILAAMVLWPWVRDGVPQRTVRVRILAGSVAAAYATTVVAVVVFAQADDRSVVAWAIAAATLGGAALYGAGLLRWADSVAWGLRLAGWALLVGVAALPSPLTLLLPVAATLSVTLFRTPLPGGPRPGADQSPAAQGGAT